MPAKTSVKKTVKTAKKPAKKVTKKVTWDNIEVERTFNKAIGGMGKTYGSIVDNILTPDLLSEFKRLGYCFDRISCCKYDGENGYAYTEDLLENGDQSVLVEVKTTLRQTDIDDLIAHIEKARTYADEHGYKRQFMGAIAAIITDEPTKNYALKNGLFVIEPSGEDVKVTKPEQEPRVW